MATKKYQYPVKSLAYQVQKVLHAALQTLSPDMRLEDIQVERPSNPEHGDYSTNMALQLTRQLKKNPLVIAEEIAGRIRNQALFAQVEVMKPGFVNVCINQQTLVDFLALIIKEREKYGQLDWGKGRTIMVEFGQPNTHKAFHVGHLKSAISGLSVVRLFEALGYKVVKANYYGDVGMQVAKTTWAMKQRGLPADFAQWSPHQRMELIDEMYVVGAKAFKEDTQAEQEIRQINTQIYQGIENEDTRLYDDLRTWSLEHLNDVFAKLGVVYDRQYPESEVYPEAIEIVKKNIGEVFTESDGAIIYDGQKAGLTTWVFLTREGNPTYSAKDLALARKKFEEYSLDQAIVTTSVEQKDYFKVVIHCLELLQPELKGKYHHIPFGWLLRHGRKTSSRLGGTVKGMDIINEAMGVAQAKIAPNKKYTAAEQQEIVEKVALAGLKFLILSHEFHKDINYDPKEFVKLRGFSGPFILYSYVRTQSVLNKIVDTVDETHPLGEFASAEEQDVLRHLAVFPEIVAQAGTLVAPHLVCTYLYELAQKFNLFYEKHSIQDASTPQDRQGRLVLTKAVGQVVQNGLALLGIETVARM